MLLISAFVWLSRKHSCLAGFTWRNKTAGNNYREITLRHDAVVHSKYFPGKEILLWYTEFWTQRQMLSESVVVGAILFADGGCWWSSFSVVDTTGLIKLIHMASDVVVMGLDSLMANVKKESVVQLAWYLGQFIPNSLWCVLTVSRLFLESSHPSHTTITYLYLVFICYCFNDHCSFSWAI